MTTKPLSNKIDLDQLAKLCGIKTTLADLDEGFCENNYCQCSEEMQDKGKCECGCCECGFEDERERLTSKYISAVESIAEDLLKEHGLKATQAKKRVCEYKIVPVESWEDAADRIRMTINGVGYFFFTTVREFMQSGPYTARECTLRHLHWVKDYYSVYGDSNGQSRLDRALRY